MPTTMITSKAHLCKLSHLAHANVYGDDAFAFLQGQLTNDLAQLTEQKPHQLSAYCNPKGRVLALFNIIKYQQGFLLIAPREVLLKTLPRLKMFVMRSSVSIEKIDNLSIHGLSNIQSFSDIRQNLDAAVIKHSLDAHRYFLLSTDEKISSSLKANLKKIHSSAWDKMDIQQNIPQVFTQNIETFIPQSINLDLLGAVNFKKGCFSGQEIIARVKYRGKPKTRMIGVTSSKINNIDIGASVYIENRNSAVGIVVNKSLMDTCEYLNITIPISHISSGKIYSDVNKTQSFDRISSPYLVHQ